MVNSKFASTGAPRRGETDMRDNSTDGLAYVATTGLTKDAGFRGNKNRLNRYWRDWSFYFSIVCAMAIFIPTMVYAWPHTWTDISYGNQHAYCVAMIVILSVVGVYNLLTGILFLINPANRVYGHQYRTIFMVSTLSMFTVCVLLLAPFITFIASFKSVDITLVSVFFRWGLLVLANICLGFIYCAAWLFHGMLYWYPITNICVITENSALEIVRSLQNVAEE